jgi:transposase
MRFYPPRTQFYCGVDLHARTMYICVVDRQGEKLLHCNLKCDRKRFLKMIAPYKTSLTVAVECVSSWYWLADLCEDEKVEFALGHAQYMRSIYGAKAKNDKIDSEKIARLVQAGLLPMAYVYPRKQRSLRDVLRRRTRFVRLRAELAAHIQCLNQQGNLPELGKILNAKEHRATAAEQFEQADMKLSAEADLAMIAHYDQLIANLEKHILARAKDFQPQVLAVLMSVPGIGKIIALTIALEIDTITRFESRQRFCSYSRLVKCSRESGGKHYGEGGKKIGNPYLKWAFSEAAVHAPRYCEPIAAYLSKLQRKHGKGKARSLLAHRLGRAVYYMLEHNQVFDLAKFLAR